MNINALHIQLNRARETLKMVENYISCLETLDPHRLPAKFEELCTEAGFQAEKATCIMRQIIFSSGTVEKTKYLRKAADTMGVTVSMHDDIFAITLPCLLPKKRGKYSGQFLLDPINAALEEFVSKNTFHKYRDCAICVVHTYDSTPSGRRFFDYDNLQQKQLLDLIATYTMVDDNALLCDVHHTSEAGDADETMVFVMAKNRLPQWLAERENNQ